MKYYSTGYVRLDYKDSIVHALRQLGTTDHYDIAENSYILIMKTLINRQSSEPILNLLRH